MSRKDRDSMEELWSKRFDEEADLTEDEPMSRKAKREKEQGISPILTVTVIFLALLIILPISAYAWFLNREDLSESPSSPSVEQVVVVEDEDDEDEIEEEEEEEEEQEEEEEEEETEEAEPESEEPELVSEPEETTDLGQSQAASSQETTDQNESGSSEEVTETVSQPEPEPDPEPEPEPEQTVEQTESNTEASYHTVSAGENMYRIALNNGMSTEELMQLNGLSDETVFIGQKLKVK
ncbi:MAG: LysM peptidoglycan-binding domain-containing protein [Alkalibacterium sp.]|nr:LysM peptidoglycan-binding domain-containing protein [Alkalibacterium sp.]